MISTDNWLRIVVAMQINAILFGAGAVTVLSVPELAAQARFLIPVVVFLAFGLSPFVSLVIYPRMRIRNWGRADWKRGDAFSG